jgi:ribose transport system substrate-binding protein
MVLLAACGSSESTETETSAATAESSPMESAAASAEETVAAESGPSTISGTPLAGKTIALVSGGPIEYYTTSLAASKMAVEQLGGTVIEYDSAFDPTKEQANVRTAITQQVDGLIMIPLSTAGTETALDLLNAANIPAVMLYGYDSSFVDKAAGFVQVDFFEYGKIVGEQFKQLVPEGPIAIILGQEGRNEVKQGSDGFREGFGNDAVIVDEIPANWDRQAAFETTQTLMTAHPDLKGIYVQNDDMAIGAVTALGDKISEVVIGSMNGSPSGIEEFAKVNFKALSQNSIPIESAQAVRILSYAINGQASLPKPCYTPIQNYVPGPDALTWAITPELVTEGLNTPCAEG